MFKHAEARSRGIKVIIAGAVAQLTCQGWLTLQLSGYLYGSLVPLAVWVPPVFRCRRLNCTCCINGYRRVRQTRLFALRLLSIEDQAIATALADFAENKEKSPGGLQMSSIKQLELSVVVSWVE